MQSNDTAVATAMTRLNTMMLKRKHMVHFQQRAQQDQKAVTCGRVSGKSNDRNLGDRGKPFASSTSTNMTTLA